MYSINIRDADIVVDVGADVGRKSRTIGKLIATLGMYDTQLPQAYI